MKKMKRISVISFALLLMLCTSLFITKDADAAQKAPKLKKLSVSTFLTDADKSFIYSVDIKNLADDAKVSKVKSSNKKVLTVKYNSYSECIYYYPKKTGKAVISCTIKQNGKTYRLKTTIRVKKGNPFKYVKLNGKNVYKDGGKQNLSYFYTSKRKVKVTFKLNSGWKLKRMYYNYHTTDKMSKNINMKNGEKIKIKKNCNYVSVKIDVKNKKGDVYRYLICLYNNENTNSVSAPVVSAKLLPDGTK